MPRSAWSFRTVAFSLALLTCLAGSPQAQTTIDWANLQFPSSITIDQNTSTPMIYGRVYVAGVTEPPGPGAGIAAEVGFGPDGTDPATAPGWQWTAATFNFDIGNDDEYVGSFTPASPGSFDYAFRYSRNSGPWVYADLDGTSNGYSPQYAGALNVDPVTLPTTIDWANLQFPFSISVSQNTATPVIYGRVYVAGVTDSPGPGAGIAAEVGFGPDGSFPSGLGGWQWTAATFNVDVGNDDEFMGSFTPADAGTFDYAFRYSRNSGPWVYADLDGTSNGYSLANAGALTVEATTGVPAHEPALRLAVQRNPCRDVASFSVTLPRDDAAELAVFDLRGARVRTLLAGPVSSGTRTVRWDGRDGRGVAAGSGLFVVRLVSGAEQHTIRLVRLR